VILLQLQFSKTEWKNLQLLRLLKYSKYLNTTNTKNSPSDTQLSCFKTALMRINTKSLAVFLKLKNFAFILDVFQEPPSLIILQHPRVHLSRLYMLFNFRISPWAFQKTSRTTSISKGKHGQKCQDLKNNYKQQIYLKSEQ